jgi:hypothetical protein
VGEGDLVLVPETEVIKGNRLYHRLRELGERRMAADAAVTTVRGERSRTKGVAVARATVRRGRR